jgi:hypothetical protein
MAKSKSRSPRSPRKTAKKRVSLASDQPIVIEFQKDFSPRNVGNLWITDDEYRNAVNEKNEGVTREDVLLKKQKIEKHREKILGEMLARNSSMQMAAMFGRRNNVAEFRSPEHVVMEEQIVVPRTSNSLSIPIPVPVLHRSPIVPQRRRSFLFQVYDGAKSMFFNKKKGGIKTQKRRKH